MFNCLIPQPFKKLKKIIVFNEIFNLLLQNKKIKF